MLPADNVHGDKNAKMAENAAPLYSINVHHVSLCVSECVCVCVRACVCGGGMVTQFSLRNLAMFLVTAAHL